MHDLSPAHLRITRKILQDRVPDLPVWVFGSRVTGKARKYSDLDLAIGGEQPLSFALLAELEHDFTESDLDFRVDIIDWTSVNDEFKAAIADQLFRLN